MLCLHMLLTCCGCLVQWPKLLARHVTGDEISETNGRERNKAVVQRVQVIPLGLKGCEDCSGDQEKERNHEHHDLMERGALY